MNPDRLYAKAQAGDGSVFVSTNGGARWEPLVVTLPVYCLAAGRGATQTVLYAGHGSQRHPEEHGRRRELERLRPRRLRVLRDLRGPERFQPGLRVAGPLRRRLVPNGRRRRDLAATPVRFAARDGPVAPPHPLRERRRDDPEEHRLRRHLVADRTPHGRPDLHGRRSCRRQPPLPLDPRAILEELRRRNDVAEHEKPEGLRFRDLARLRPAGPRGSPRGAAPDRPVQERGPGRYVSDDPARPHSDRHPRPQDGFAARRARSTPTPRRAPSIGATTGAARGAASIRFCRATSWRSIPSTPSPCTLHRGRRRGRSCTAAGTEA